MIDGLLIGWALKQSVDKAQSDTGSSLASAAKSQADSLQLEVDKLSMIAEALWLILKDKCGCTDQELVAMIEQIDMRDGKRDGKIAKQAPKTCPNCGRTLMKRTAKCLYCGQEIEWEPFEK